MLCKFLSESCVDTLTKKLKRAIHIWAMSTMIDHRVRESIWQLNFLKWALPQNRAKWSFDRQKWIKLKNCVRIVFGRRQNCATFKRPPFVWRTQSLQNRNPSDADFPFFSHEIHISVIVKNLDFCFGTRQKYSSGAFYVFGGFAKNMAVRDSAEDLIVGRLR